MDNKICFNRNMVILLIMLIVIVIIIVTLLIVKIIIIKNKQQNTRIRKIKTVSRVISPLNPVDVVREYDYKKLDDILEEPTRRVPRHEIPPMYVKGYLDYPTRGYPDNFSQLGLLIAVDKNKKDSKDNKILRLFGRQVYPGSSEYEYYTAINSSYDQIKVSLNTKRRELYDGDIIKIKELGAKYKVKLHRYDAPKYYPDLIV